MRGAVRPSNGAWSPEIPTSSEDDPSLAGRSLHRLPESSRGSFHFFCWSIPNQSFVLSIVLTIIYSI